MPSSCRDHPRLVLDLHVQQRRHQHEREGENGTAATPQQRQAREHEYQGAREPQRPDGPSNSESDQHLVFRRAEQQRDQKRLADRHAHYATVAPRLVQRVNLEADPRRPQ